MSKARNTVKFLIYVAVIACIGYFFYLAFKRNWASVAAHQFVFDYVFLALAGGSVLGCSLLATWGWHLGVNSLSSSGKLTFAQSVATVNSSSLTKYLPGKVWSYAFQMYWLGAAGFSKSLVMYVNIVSLFVSLVTSLICGLIWLLWDTGSLPFGGVLASLLAVVLLDVLSMRFHTKLFRFLIALINRVLKRELRYFEPSARLLWELHALNFSGAVLFGLAAYFTSAGIGYHLTLAQAPRLISALLIADIVGFLAIFVPGGLGVREGFMYMMLGGGSSGSIALTLPLATRMITMVTDLVLGAVALRLLKSFSANRPKPLPGSEGPIP